MGFCSPKSWQSHWQLNGTPGLKPACSSLIPPLQLAGSGGCHGFQKKTCTNISVHSSSIPMVTEVRLDGKEMGRLELRPGTHRFLLCSHPRYDDICSACAKVPISGLGPDRDQCPNIVPKKARFASSPEVV